MSVLFRIIVTTLICFLCSASAAFSFEYAEAKATLKVLDENGKYIQGAQVGIGYYSKKERKGAISFNGVTDRSGQFSAIATTHGEFGFFADKDGYYRTSGRYREWILGNVKIKGGKWEPWNPTVEVVLREVKDPVPMYAKRVSTTLPFADKPCGFDLERGDWVAPYGIGVKSDFVFIVSRTGKEWGDFEVVTKLYFSNDGDGIQEVSATPQNKGSVFRLPRNAPENNYKTKWMKKLGNNSEDGYYNLETESNKAFIYRVRTKYDKNGKIISARYGKIHGDFKVTGYLAPQLSLDFIYYFNPDGTTNLEFNPKQNLFRNLSGLEQVREP